MREGFGVLIE
jgi:hypothetical protein